MSFLSTCWYPVSFHTGFFSFFMSSPFNPETVSSLLCCYRYTALLRVQVLPVRAPFVTLVLDEKKNKTNSLRVFFCLIPVKVQLSSPYVPCFCSHLFFVSLSVFLTPLSLWGTALFLRSQVVNKGGINCRNAAWLGGLGNLGGSLIPSPSTSSFSLSLGSHPLLLFLLQDCLAENYFSFVSSLIHLLPSGFILTTSHSSKDSGSRHMACGCE